jgi:hypothetical protein
MTMQMRAFHHHLNLYHHQPGLLFQFILSDFLAIQREGQTLQSLHTSPASPIERDRYFASLSKLVGNTQNTVHLFAWNRDKSLLSKFKTYCGLYAQSIGSNLENKQIYLLQRTANQAWLYSIQCLELLHTLKHDDQNQKIGESLIKINSKLLTSLNRTTKILSPLFEGYQNDENVLLFILRSRKELDEVFGNEFVLGLFAKMHPEGLLGIANLLIERYTKRGFEQLLPLIKSLTQP